MVNTCDYILGPAYKSNPKNIYQQTSKISWLIREFIKLTRTALLLSKMEVFFLQRLNETNNDFIQQSCGSLWKLSDLRGPQPRLRLFGVAHPIPDDLAGTGRQAQDGLRPPPGEQKLTIWLIFYLRQFAVRELKFWSKNYSEIITVLCSKVFKQWQLVTVIIKFI